MAITRRRSTGYSSPNSEDENDANFEYGLMALGKKASGFLASFSAHWVQTGCKKRFGEYSAIDLMTGPRTAKISEIHLPYRALDINRGVDVLFVIIDDSEEINESQYFEIQKASASCYFTLIVHLSERGEDAIVDRTLFPPESLHVHYPILSGGKGNPLENLTQMISGLIISIIDNGLICIDVEDIRSVFGGGQRYLKYQRFKQAENESITAFYTRIESSCDVGSVSQDVMLLIEGERKTTLNTISVFAELFGEASNSECNHLIAMPFFYIEQNQALAVAIYTCH